MAAPVVDELAPTSAVAPRPVVEVRDLVKSYGGVPVLHGVSFTVREGELFGLLGTNGAGKTTTVEILQGLRAADGGVVRVGGIDPAHGGERLRRLIGSQLQSAALPDRLRVGEALRFFASLHPHPRPPDELAAEWQLDRLLRRPFGALSGGERQRLFVALALVGRPRLVFLDELTQSLDAIGRRHTWDVVRQIRAAGTTVVLVTHDVEEAERVCDRIVVLHSGRIVADGTPSSIVASRGRSTTVKFSDRAVDLDELRLVPGAERVTRNGAEVDVVGTGALLAHVGAHLVAHGHHPVDLRGLHPTLEEHFIDLVEEKP